MARSRFESLLTRMFDDESNLRVPDRVVVEEPLTIHLDDVRITSTMRTPGHDFELAAGFLKTEGALGPAPITGIRYCGTGASVDSEFNVVSVETRGLAPGVPPRMGSISSSCGICGSEAIDELSERLPVLGTYDPWDLEMLASLPNQMMDKQKLFAETGGAHGAAAVSRQGEVLAVREDIGRHNAVDKVIGRLLLDGRLPASDLALVTSGRGSFEMVQKAWAAGFTALVAVSAPSALAVGTARRAGMTLMGFARQGVGKIYSPDTLL